MNSKNLNANADLLWDAILRLHMINNGLSEPQYGINEAEQLNEFIRYRIDHWDHTPHAHYSEFDYMVKGLARMVILEHAIETDLCPIRNAI